MKANRRTHESVAFFHLLKVLVSYSIRLIALKRGDLRMELATLDNDFAFRADGLDGLFVSALVVDDVEGALRGDKGRRSFVDNQKVGGGSAVL